MKSFFEITFLMVPFHVHLYGEDRVTSIISANLRDLKT
jgi:hypothetical protein